MSAPTLPVRCVNLNGQCLHPPKTQQSSDLENVDGPPSEESSAQQAVTLEKLRDLPPMEGTAPDEAPPTPFSTQPPPTTTTTATTIIGSLPADDQLETPLAEIAEQEAADHARGDKQVAGQAGGDKQVAGQAGGGGGGELKEDVGNLEKSRTDVTEGRQGTEGTEKGSEVTEKGSEVTEKGTEEQAHDGVSSEATDDSTHLLSKTGQPPSKVRLRESGDVTVRYVRHPLCPPSRSFIVNPCTV